MKKDILAKCIEHAKKFVKPKPPIGEVKIEEKRIITITKPARRLLNETNKN